MAMTQRGEPCYCGVCARCLRRLRVAKFRENQRRAALGEPLLPANKGGPRKLAPDEHRLTPRNDQAGQRDIGEMAKEI